HEDVDHFFRERPREDSGVMMRRDLGRFLPSGNVNGPWHAAMQDQKLRCAAPRCRPSVPSVCGQIILCQRFQFVICIACIRSVRKEPRLEVSSRQARLPFCAVTVGIWRVAFLPPPDGLWLWLYVVMRDVKLHHHEGLRAWKEEVRVMRSLGKIYTIPAVAVIVIFIAAFIANSEGSEKGQIAYPKGYRHWTHVKSMVIQQGHALYDSFGGIHHIYANEKALKAMKENRTYPDGSIFIFDLLEAKAEDNAIVEGSRKVLGVMHKDARKYSATGGWGFEGFKGDSRERVVTDPVKSCFHCHEAHKDSDYVFSKYRR
ncbi:MAG TPA: cytochrome P460 family protein, partial [Geobacteraceae bacterium]|nr:cytochrome P460 family protein [Geobacteraceae bacterium]